MLTRFLLHLLGFAVFVIFLFSTLATYVPLHECSNYDLPPDKRINVCEDALEIPEVQRETELRSAAWIHIGIAHSELFENSLAFLAFERAIFEALDSYSVKSQMADHLDLLRKHASRDAIRTYLDARAKFDDAPTLGILENWPN